MKTVYDWKFFCTNSDFCDVVLFNNDEGKVVYEGMFDEVPSEYYKYCVQSFDPVSEEEPYLCLNIGLE